MLWESLPEWPAPAQLPASSYPSERLSPSAGPALLPRPRLSLTSDTWNTRGHMVDTHQHSLCSSELEPQLLAQILVTPPEPSLGNMNSLCNEVLALLFPAQWLESYFQTQHLEALEQSAWTFRHALLPHFSHPSRPPYHLLLLPEYQSLFCIFEGFSSSNKFTQVISFVSILTCFGIYSSLKTFLKNKYIQSQTSLGQIGSKSNYPLNLTSFTPSSFLF